MEEEQRKVIDDLKNNIETQKEMTDHKMGSIYEDIEMFKNTCNSIKIIKNTIHSVRMIIEKKKLLQILNPSHGYIITDQLDYLDYLKNQLNEKEHVLKLNLYSLIQDTRLGLITDMPSVSKIFSGITESEASVNKLMYLESL